MPPTVQLELSFFKDWLADNGNGGAALYAALATAPASGRHGGFGRGACSRARRRLMGSSAAASCRCRRSSRRWRWRPWDQKGSYGEGVAMVEGRLHGGLHRPPKQDDDDDGKIYASLPFPSTFAHLCFPRFHPLCTTLASTTNSWPVRYLEHLET